MARRASKAAVRDVPMEAAEIGAGEGIAAAVGVGGKHSVLYAACAGRGTAYLPRRER